MASKERVHGPYEHRNKWRVVGVKADGSRIREVFADFGEAKRWADEARAALGQRTLGLVVDEYLRSMTERGRREGTVDTARYRLVAFLRLASADVLMERLTPAAARALYAARALEVRPDTHHGELALASTWAAWCVKRGYLPTDPFEGIERVGQRSTGKDQLRLDEARRFLASALGEGSRAGDACALAALTGARASEVTDRVVRDVDDGGRMLWVTEAKTAAGVRQLMIPSVLQPRVVALTKGRLPTERLWGDVTRHWLAHHVRRLCDVAKVPVVSPHGLRGLYATVRVAVLGDDAERVAAAMGHENAGITRRAYVAPGAEQERDQVRLAERLLDMDTPPTPDKY